MRGNIEVDWEYALQGPVCGEAAELDMVGANATVTCAGGTISNITFASYGVPEGSCGAFKESLNCHAPTSMQVPLALFAYLNA